MNNFKAYIYLTRLDKPVGVYLVLWPTLFALWLAADGFPGWHLLVVFVLGAVIMRSAGCVINDYADRNFDGLVARTCKRPLVVGLISSKSALIFFIILCLSAFFLVLTLNFTTVIWSLGAVLLAGLYPFMKRYTYWPQVFLGAAFAWAIPMSFVAINETVPNAAWVIYALVMVWALIYDTAYAIGDKQDDLKIGVKSTAILFGKYVNQIIGLFQILMLVLLVWIGELFNLTNIYYGSIGLVLLLFIYHQYLLSKRNDKLAFKVFLSNHWAFFIVWLAVVTDKTIG
jgi:4-hydroxybenzoate polyprenyltransferase